jgi:hypothetical protein
VCCTVKDKRKNQDKEIQMKYIKQPPPPETWMSAFCKCCVLWGRGLCNGPIPRPEKSYRLCCVIVCYLETSRMRRFWPELGCCARENLPKFKVLLYPS